MAVLETRTLLCVIQRALAPNMRIWKAVGCTVLQRKEMLNTKEMTDDKGI
jgi:hypothetical protein